MRSSANVRSLLHGLNFCIAFDQTLFVQQMLKRDKLSRWDRTTRLTSTDGRDIAQQFLIKGGVFAHCLVDPSPTLQKVQAIYRRHR